MIEIIAFGLLVYWFLDRRSKRKSRPKKLRGLDGELQQLIETTGDATGIALEIRTYLLALIADNANDLPKFSDDRIAQAQKIYDRAGPAAMYWMSEIAAQLAYLSAAQINNIPNNVTDELKNGATAEAVVKLVVRV
jgi:hypothetical protein